MCKSNTRKVLMYTRVCVHCACIFVSVSMFHSRCIFVRSCVYVDSIDDHKSLSFIAIFSFTRPFARFSSSSPTTHQFCHLLFLVYCVNTTSNTLHLTVASRFERFIRQHTHPVLFKFLKCLYFEINRKSVFFFSSIVYCSDLIITAYCLNSVESSIQKEFKSKYFIQPASLAATHQICVCVCLLS